MKRVLKWTLKTEDEQTLTLPMGAKILTVQMQGSYPQLWAECSAETQLTSPRKIRIAGTGHKLPNTPRNYISTFQMHGGSLVFHVFEELE